MNPAMWISKTGVQAQDQKLQAIANNLANANTVGFKRDRVVFEDLFYSIEQQPGAQVADNNTLAPSGVQLGNGVHMVGTQKVFTNGSLQTTGRDLDVAVMGNGFMAVRQPNGETAYTRAGQLQVDANGILVNAHGLPLIPQITVPAGRVDGCPVGLSIVASPGHDRALLDAGSPWANLASKEEL